MKKLFGMLLVVVTIIVIGAKPWETEETDHYLNMNVKSETASYTCPRCNGSKVCRVCHGSAVRYNQFTNETKECAVCHKNPGVCQTCGGTGVVSAAEYNRIKSLSSNNGSAANSEKSGSQCYYCNGSGKCHVCVGLGKTFVGSNSHVCGLCKGSGVCKHCHGSGKTASK